MKHDAETVVSLTSSGARVQFAIGVALVSVIPLLAFWYLSAAAEATGSIEWNGQAVAVLLILLALGASGFSILRKFPVNIVRLRFYLERIIKGELPEHVKLLRAEDDICAVEQCLNLLLRQLRERLALLQTEKKSLQEQLYQAQKMESLGVMAAGIAHDFNNILLGILTHVELLSDDAPEEPAFRQGLKEIEDFVHRASELTNQMLVYAGRGRFEMQSVDLSHLIRELNPLLLASVRKEVDVVCELAEKLPSVMGDPVQIRQIVMNLVINASDAMGEKRGVVKVATRAAVMSHENTSSFVRDGRVPEGPFICVEVRDSGCGMSKEQVEKVFDPFFSTKPKGRGLGLAVVLGIVKSHNGFIGVESVLGKGTCFRVYLPVPDVMPARG
jgi:signal transduction histidine kinase